MTFLLSVLFVGATSVPARQLVDQQLKNCIAWRLEVANAKDATTAIKTHAGKDVAALELKVAEGMRLFSLDAAILDLSAGIVRVTVHSGRNGPVVDEFDVKAGAGTVRSSTVPSFGVAAVEIYDVNPFYGPN